METFGVVSLPAMTDEQGRMWDLILTLSDRLGPQQWSLVGGQMVALYAAHAGVTWPRVTRDIDMLANMEVMQDNLKSCTAVLRDLGLRVQLDNAGAAYRFSDTEKPAPGSLVVDLLAPDHRKKLSALWTSKGRTIQIDGGTQALQRVGTFEVHLANGRAGLVPVPNLLGAIVLKAAAWAADTRERERHAQDVALLVSLIDDPAELVEEFRGSDRKRIFKLRSELDAPAAQAWLLLGPEAAELGRANWAELTT
jgi:predicted nucleotidyltransferase